MEFIQIICPSYIEPESDSRVIFGIRSIRFCAVTRTCSCQGMCSCTAILPIRYRKGWPVHPVDLVVGWIMHGRVCSSPRSHPCPLCIHSAGRYVPLSIVLFLRYPDSWNISMTFLWDPQHLHVVCSLT